MSRLEPFDIRNFRNRLNIVNEESTQLVCECPVCGGHRLTIDKETGKYQCWSGECECKHIRDTLAPLPSQGDVPRRQTPKARPVQKPKLPAPPNTEVHLAKLPAPATDTPQSQKDFDPKLKEILKTTYVYSLTPEGNLNRWVIRTDWNDATKPKGRDKTFRQWHRSEAGEPICKKGDVPWEPYRRDEFIQALKATTGCPVGLVVEGEKCVEICRQSGLAAITLQGSAWGKEDLQRLAERVKSECPDAILVFLPDNDATGQKKAKALQEVCDRAGIFCIIIDPLTIYPDLNEGGDVVEILAAMDTPEFIRRLEEEIHKAVESRRQQAEKEDSESVDIPDSLDPNTEFTQKALNFLYGDKRWICANDKLYYWTGTYYKESLDAVERPKIASFCNSYPVRQRDGSIRYPYAQPSEVRKVLQWVKDRLEVDPSLLDPPGLNCTNGVLQLSWDGSTPSWDLVNHDPSLYYSYEPIVTYNPNADPQSCERLLEVLDAPQREIFLRTIAASLDLATVRRYKGRLVRVLLNKGLGSNGKDTLREAVAAMYGYRGITEATLTDFAVYDEGRKFNLSRLKHSRVNWASENVSVTKLDKLQSLKAFATGDPIDVEAKGKDGFEINPVGVALFNLNDVPNLQGSLEAILSRYGVLTFNKTFKIGADPTKGELEADPRYKYDPDFLRSEVLPAFLNRVLDALVHLMAEGIDYSCTQQALEDIQAQNSHLFQFAQDTGLRYSPSGSLSIGQIWERLRQWYIDNGTLTIEVSDNGKEKVTWVDQVKKSDPNVKGANQVLARFIQLFPKAKRCHLGNNKMGIQGLAFGISQLDPEISQLATEISQSLASSLASKPDTARVISQLSQFPNPHGENDEDKKDFTQNNWEKPESHSQVEKLPQLANNPDTATDTASTVANELANSSGELANELANPSAEVTNSLPQQPATTESNPNLEIGDSIRDTAGRLEQIARVAVAGWLTAAGTHISRDDLKAGIYTKVALTQSEPTEAEADAEVLTDFANAIDDPQMVLDLTQAWTEEHKREVWRLLKPELRQKYRDLMSGEGSDRNE